MHVRNMMFCLVTVFLLAAAFVWATYDPDMTSGESSELIEAYNSYNTLYQQGRCAEAAPPHQRALTIREKALGPEHPDVATILENYSALLRETGRANEAERMEARAKAIRAKSE